MRRMFLVSALLLAMLAASGVALAATVRCAQADGACYGTPRSDLMTGTAERDLMRAKAARTNCGGVRAGTI